MNIDMYRDESLDEDDPTQIESNFRISSAKLPIDSRDTHKRDCFNRVIGKTQNFHDFAFFRLTLDGTIQNNSFNESTRKLY